jgi:hypothetical protein
MVRVSDPERSREGHSDEPSKRGRYDRESIMWRTGFACPCQQHAHMCISFTDRGTQEEGDDGVHFYQLNQLRRDVCTGFVLVETLALANAEAGLTSCIMLNAVKMRHSGIRDAMCDKGNRLGKSPK